MGAGGVLQNLVAKLTGGGNATNANGQSGNQGAANLDEWAKRTWIEVKESCTSYHQSSWESLLFYAGQTWVKWDANRKIFEPETPADDWVPQPRINRFSPTVDSVVANFATVPEIEATAGEQDDDPLVWAVADIASRLADDWMEKVGLHGGADDQEEDKVGNAAQTFVLMGGCFTEVSPYEEKLGKLPVTSYQDSSDAQCLDCDQYHTDVAPTGLGPDGQPTTTCPSCGNPNLPIIQSQKKVPVMDPANPGAPLMQDVTRTDACCNIVLPIFVIPRPGSKSISDSDYTFWAERQSINKVFFESGQEVEPDNEVMDGYEAGYKHALDYFYQGTSQATSSHRDSALIVKCYVAPNKVKDFPDGAYVCMTQAKVVKSGAWEYQDHPLSFAPYQRIPTLFHGRSIAFELTGVQKEYQSYESLIKLHGMVSAAEPIVVDENTQVTQITGRSDKVIKWRSLGPGSKEPHRMPHGQLDEGIYRQRQSLRDEFENTSGAVGVYKGMQPGSITAASAIDKLKGQAEMVFSKPVLNWHSLWKQTVRKAVKIRQKSWTPDQIAEVVGNDKLVHIQNFKNADLDKVIKWVATNHGLPRSRDERKAEMLMLWDRGALDVTDPNVREKAFELFGDTGMMNNFNLDATRARVENQGMKAGIMATVMPEIEDMGVHLAIHLQVAKSLDFDQWPQPAKTMMLQHIMQTKLAMQQAQIQMMAMNPEAAAGKPPAGPGGGKPPGGGVHPVPPKPVGLPIGPGAPPPATPGSSSSGGAA